MSTLTAPSTINLTTPRGIVTVLAEVGIDWSPTPATFDGPHRETGLYAWVDGKGSECACGSGQVSPDLLDRGVLYVGIGGGEKGVLGRLREEHGLIGDQASHAHGIAMHRRGALPVAGSVAGRSADLSWLDAPLVNTDGAAKARTWLENVKADPTALLLAAEHLAIRAGIHLGDVGAPVNSARAGAWENYHAADWAAWAAVRHLSNRGVS